jgi:hypothetical protein
MKPVDERLWALRHEPEGPLVPFLDAFANYLDEQGYKRHRLGRQIRVVAKFSKWLQAKTVAAEGVTDKHVQSFFEEVLPSCSAQSGERAALRRFIELLIQLDVIHFQRK